MDLTVSWDLLDADAPWPAWLETVAFVDGSPTEVALLPASAHLHSLTLAGLSTLDGLPRFPNLRSLSVSRCRRLIDLQGLSGTPQLEFLELNGCPELPPLDPVSQLHHLTRLWILDCGRVPSLRPLAHHTDLAELLAYGSTDIQDSDLGPLLTMPALRRLAMGSRRKYRPKLADVVHQRGLSTE